MGTVEALYIFNEHNNAIFEQYYSGRPPPPINLIQLYLAQPQPRPALISLPNTSPSTLLYSHLHDQLLFLCPTSDEAESILVTEFLHRLADVLEEFLGPPLLTSKIEANYDAVVQIAGEVCDAGIVHNTEPNALREVVQVDDWVGNLLGGIGLPSSSPALTRSQSPSLSSAPFASGISNTTASSAAGSAVLWRRSNVKHTSNELYVDIVEILSVILAPSGRPVSAFAHGTIAFNARISGIPDLLLSMSAPGGRQGVERAMSLPCFHPCVRLSKWRERPGELSFVPPDGRFALAGYECDLLPGIFDDNINEGKIPVPNVTLPVSVEIIPCLGLSGDELEVKLSLPLRVAAGSSSNLPSSGSAAIRSLNNATRPGQGSSSNASANGGPTPENIVVSVPMPPKVRSVNDIRCSKGEAHYIPTDGELEWRISGREAATIGSAGATLRCSVVGSSAGARGQQTTEGLKLKTDTFDYDEGLNEMVQEDNSKNPDVQQEEKDSSTDHRTNNALLMPQTASLSFNVKGWLASGLRVDALMVNTKSSKGLGAGVTPYKGVKYHTISRRGIEVRC